MRWTRHHPDPTLDQEGKAVRLGKILYSPDHVGMGPGEVIAAAEASRLQLPKPEVEILPEDRIVMHAVQENQIQGLVPVFEIADWHLDERRRWRNRP